VEEVEEIGGGGSTSEGRDHGRILSVKTHGRKRQRQRQRRRGGGSGKGASGEEKLGQKDFAANF
jgi:hypothetical protein